MKWGNSLRPIRFACAVGLGVLALAGARAPAQTIPEPAALERTIPQDVRQTTASPTIRGPLGAPSPRSRTTKRFTLGAVDIQGAKVFSREDLSQYFEPLLASEVDGAKLAELAGHITQRYRQSGYLLSYASVPSQNVQAGVVSLAVIEGKIDRLAIEGAGTDRSAVEAIAAPLIADSPLRAATLERAIGLLRDFPGLRVMDIALTRTDTEAGLYGLQIRVAPNRVRGFSYVDNRGADSAARMRFYSSASLSSLAVAGDEFRVDLFTMPGRSFRYVYGHIVGSVPLGRNGLRLRLEASKGDQYLRGDQRFDGNSRNVSALLSYPFRRERALTLVGKASLNDWRSWADEGGAPKLRDRLRIARVGLEFSTERRTRLQGEIWLAQGLGFDGMTKAGDPLASRPDASGRFTKAEFALRVTQPIDGKVRLQGSLAGQYSTRSLLSVEEFALGGSRIGRAFDFNEITGDHGIGGAMELAYRLDDGKGRIKNIELFAYADGGATFRKHERPGLPDKQWLAGAGVGGRLSIGGMILSGEVGVPIARSHADRDVRAFVSIARAF
ncbi:MAG TPA: ShlB/FhaC/HecB family hemolysin secretion/activation protein [Sphingomicrobium sp.]|nr:ShlB/FhaC/HecB family hemolysin secretion/activation protein [Sphingomicrobium sp.]